MHSLLPTTVSQGLSARAYSKLSARTPSRTDRHRADASVADQLADKSGGRAQGPRDVAHEKVEVLLPGGGGYARRYVMDRVLQALAFGDVANDRDKQRLFADIDARQGDLGVEERAVAADMLPFEALGSVLQSDLDHVPGFFAGLAFVGLELRREVVGCLTDELLTRAAEQLERRRVTVDERLALKHHYGVRRVFENGAAGADVR